MFDAFLWGNYAAGYHITNLVLHGICTWLVYLFSKRLCAKFFVEQPVLPIRLLSAALFFVYPFHSEGVFWILGRSAVLGAIFSLVFLLFFLKEERQALDTAISLLAFTIALLTYESSWVLPLVAWVLLWQRGGGPFRIAKQRNAFVALAVIFMLYLFARWQVNKAIVGDYEGVNFLQFNIGTLLQNLFKLAARSFTTYLEAPLTLTIAFSLLTALILFLIIKRSCILVVKLLLCFIISLLPYLSLGIDTHGTEGERFIYLPSVFAVLLAIYCINNIGNKYVTYVFTAFLSIAYAAQLYINAANYRFAGSVVKQTIAQLHAVPAGKNIVIEGLPKSQHGALILAAGLQDAVALLGADKQMPEVAIASRRYQLDALQMPYKTVVLPLPTDAPTIKFRFTDSVLLIYK
jgi:hypothetical protein